jgi:F0F1-type ATP synthase assembly protein I
MSDPLPPSTPDNSGWRHVFAGASFAIAIVCGVFAGVWVDHRWNTEPWGALCGSLAGIVAGTYNLIREFKDESDKHH